MEAGGWDRSPDAYSAGKRKKVRTTTNMASSSTRGGGGGPRDLTEMFAFTFSPSFHHFLLEGNIIEEIPFLFRFFFKILWRALDGSFLKGIEVRRRSFFWRDKDRR